METLLFFPVEMKELQMSKLSCIMFEPSAIWFFFFFLVNIIRSYNILHLSPVWTAGFNPTKRRNCFGRNGELSVYRNQHICGLAVSKLISPAVLHKGAKQNVVHCWLHHKHFVFLSSSLCYFKLNIRPKLSWEALEKCWGLIHRAFFFFFD